MLDLAAAEENSRLKWNRLILNIMESRVEQCHARVPFVNTGGLELSSFLFTFAGVCDASMWGGMPKDMPKALSGWTISRGSHIIH